MIVTIKYFGLLADITKKTEEQLVLEETQLSVSALKLMTEKLYAELQNTSYAIAINQSMAGSNTEIKDQDVIALLPPFAGG